MAHREDKKAIIIKDLSNEVAERLLALPIGSRTSIQEIVNCILFERGYNLRRWNHEDIYTKDGGKTYIIKYFDMFDILEQVQSRLKKKRYFYYGIPRGKRTGFPFHMYFTVLETKPTEEI